MCIRDRYENRSEDEAKEERELASDVIVAAGEPEGEIGAEVPGAVPGALDPRAHGLGSLVPGRWPQMLWTQRNLPPAASAAQR